MISIEKMQAGHWPQVKAIYEDGIKTGNATFEISAPQWESWDKAHIQQCRLVAVENKKVLGWAALVPVSGRCVYAGVAEVSVYINADARGRGLGRLLLQKLVEESEANHLWTLQAGIFPENIASIAIHQSNGFRIIGRREKIGRLNGIWRDTLLLERRSDKVGI
jgi:phosphinothricin acetyltransferase